MKKDDPKVQLAVVGVIAIIVVTIALNAIYGGSNETQSVIVDNEFKKEIKEVAGTSRGEDAYYKDAFDWEDVNEPYYRSLLTIENTNSCMILYKLFDDNTAWHARPLLAEKIVRLCL